MIFVKTRDGDSVWPRGIVVATQKRRAEREGESRPQRGRNGHGNMIGERLILQRNHDFCFKKNLSALDFCDFDDEGGRGIFPVVDRCRSKIVGRFRDEREGD